MDLSQQDGLGWGFGSLGCWEWHFRILPQQVEEGKAATALVWMSYQFVFPTSVP